MNILVFIATVLVLAFAASGPATERDLGRPTAIGGAVIGHTGRPGMQADYETVCCWFYVRGSEL